MTYFAAAMGHHATRGVLPGFERGMGFVGDDPDRCFAPRLGGRAYRIGFEPTPRSDAGERIEEDPERWDGLS